MLQKSKDEEYQPEQTFRNFQKYSITQHSILKQEQIANRTLNVLDEELLVYYGKMKNRKFTNEVTKTQKPYLKPFRSKNISNESNNFTKYLDIGLRTSIQFKNATERENNWK